MSRKQSLQPIYNTTQITMAAQQSQQQLTCISLLVLDYDEALEFYIGKLNFELIEDTQISRTKRWITIQPRGNSENATKILLVKAQNYQQVARTGDQAAGKVFLFLNTDNMEADFNNLIANDINIIQEPTERPHGIVAIFEDIYGNKWDLIQPNTRESNQHSE
jgi:catechol 2,3-dioxygenase-like lactoylglutathione lyase family enzyme